jgi:hypothetical protein
MWESFGIGRYIYLHKEEVSALGMAVHCDGMDKNHQ